jgi:hypothetical protein
MANEPNMEHSAAEKIAQARKQLGESIERNLDRGSRTAAHLDRTLISLSAGALILSMTFVRPEAPEKGLLVVLFSSWFFFIAAMILVIFAIRSEQNALDSAVNNASACLELLKDESVEVLAIMGVPPTVEKKVTASNTVALLNNSALVAFIIGVLLLGAFVGASLWH